MFNNNAQIESAEKAPCRPDPEKILENIRKRKEEVSDALDKTKILGGARIPAGSEIRTGMVHLVGQLIILLWELEQQEESVLDQINEESV